MSYELRESRTIVGRAKSASAAIPPTYLPETEVAFGSMTNAVTGSSAFIYTVGSSTVDIFGTAGTFEASPGNLKIYSGSNASNITPTTIEISGSSNTGTFTDASMIFNGGSNIATFSDITATYQTSTSTANISGSGMSVAAGNNTGLFQNNSITFNNLTNDTSYGSSSAKIAGLSPVTSSVLDSGGDLTLTQTNSNVIQLLTTDLTALAITGKTIKIQPVMCQNNSTGLLVTGYFLVGF